MSAKKYEPKHAAKPVPGDRKETISRNIEASSRMTKTKGMAEEQRAPKRKSRKALKIFAIGLLMIGVILLGAYVVFSHYYSKMNVTVANSPVDISEIDYSSMELQPISAVDQEPTIDSNWDYSAKEVKNILLIGVDNDYLPGMDNLGNADGLILVSINENTKQVVLTSLMRDISVRIGDQYMTKLTLAYHYGGTRLLIDAIEQNFGVPIDNYILLNYINIVDIVDAFGGITLDVTSEELFWMKAKITNINELIGRPAAEGIIPPEEAGTQTLNGVQTAAYMRIRYAGDGDRERTERMRRVITKLKDKALGMSIGEFTKLASTILPCINTDLSQSDVLSLMMNALTYMKYDMISNRLPIEGSYQEISEGGSYVMIDFSKNNEYLYYTIYEGHEPEK